MNIVDIGPNLASVRCLEAFYARMKRRQMILIRRSLHWSVRRDPQRATELIVLYEQRARQLAQEYMKS